MNAKTKEKLELEALELSNRKLRAELERGDNWYGELFKPFTATLLAAVVTAIGTIAVSAYSSQRNIELEDRKLRNELLIRFLAVGDATTSVKNLEFLIDTGLAKDIEIPAKYLNPANAPVLPASNPPRRRIVTPAKCDLRFNYVSPDKVILADNWEALNIVSVEIPQLKPFGIDSVKINKVAADALKKTFAELEASNLMGFVKSYEGSFVARTIRGSTTTLSPHACGLAIDLNAMSNRIGTAGAALGEAGTLLPLVPIFERNGFVWGGYFARPDPTHFEYQGASTDDTADAQ